MKSFIAVVMSACACALDTNEVNLTPPNTTTLVIQTPDLLRDPNNSFLGTMGPCGIPELYETYLSKGELYHCGMAEQIYEWSKS